MPMIHDNRLIQGPPRPISRMTMSQLIGYERLLWRWMDKADSPASVAVQLNAVHREVEWRAQDTEFKRKK